MNLRVKIEDLMQQYDKEEIVGATYAQKMMELTAGVQNDKNDD